MDDEESASSRRVEVLLQLKRWDEAAAMAGHLVASSPGDAEALVLLARALHGAGRDGEAINAAHAAQAAAPGWDEPFRIEAWALKASSPGMATVCARQATNLNPQRAANWTTLALTSSSAGGSSVQEARAAAAEARRLAPDWSESMNASGIVALRAKDYRDAEQWFRRGLAIDPSSSDLLNNLGLAISKQGRMDEAVALFERNLASSPGSQASRQNLGATVNRQIWRSGPWQLAVGGVVVIYLRDLFGTSPVGWLGLAMVVVGVGWGLINRARVSEAQRSAIKDFKRHHRDAHSSFGQRGKWIIVGLIVALIAFLVVWGQTHPEPTSGHG